MIMRSNRGFTLVELIVVITVASVVMTMTWGSLPKLMAHYRLDGAARKLMADAQKARFRAIAERKCFQMKFDNPVPVGSYEVRTDAGAIGNCVTAAYGSVDSARRVDPTGNGLTVASTANPIFDTRGTVNTISTITLTNAYGATRQVRIEATGRIRIS